MHKRPDRHTPTLLAALAVAAAPHFLRVPFWIPLWTLALWGFILRLHLAGKPLPSKRLLRGALAVGLGGAFIAMGGGFNLRAGVSFLLVLASLRPFEVATPRDRMTTLLLCYFLAAFNLLASQSIATALAMAASVLATTAGLMHVNHPGPLARSKLRLTAKLMLQALPMTLVLFVVFPRMPGNLLGFLDSRSYTGFTDTMDLGDVSDLAQSSTPVFRVEFEGPAPPPQQLYWRGLTLNTYAEGQWMRGPFSSIPSGNLVAREPTAYTLTMEPHGQTWLFALDMPLSSPPGTTLRPDRTLELAEELENPRRFQMNSALAYNLDADAIGRKAALERNLLLPPRVNPRARQLARQWAAQEESDLDIARAALEMFRNQPFHYTLHPPDLGANEVDDFLFNTRRGFCEHYASAFAFLMRAAGVPCRVVMGYQGADLNPMGDYLIVRQSNAHAWNEIWLEGRGWVRADPTAAVAPQRIESGPSDALTPDEAADQAPLFSSSSWGLVRDMALAWDAVNYYWTQWVLDYTDERQMDLFSRLGLDTDSGLAWLQAALAGLGVLALFAALALLRARFKLMRRDRDPVLAAYRRFCAKLGRAGMPRPPHMGPRDYEQFVVQARPDLAEATGKIIDLYVSLRYAGDASPDHARRLRQAAAAFTPGNGPRQTRGDRP